jgi:MFS family permease
MWSSVIGIPLMITSFGKFGFTPTVIGIGSLMVFIGIISWFWLRDTPEEVGLNPDNIPITEEERKTGLGQAKSSSKWSTRELLSQKTTILFIVGWGLFALGSAGAPMIMIPFFMEIGFLPPVAIAVFSLGAFVGVGFSVVLGAIDTKIGPRKSTIIFSVIFFTGFFSAFICSRFGLRWPAAICLHLAGGASGGFANLAASYIASVYGRESFPHVFRVIWTGSSLFRALVFVLIGSVIAFLGSYTAIVLVFSFCCVVGGVMLACVSDNYIIPPTERHAESINN